MCEINAEDPTFDGLHRLALPWSTAASRRFPSWVDAGFINDGDADRSARLTSAAILVEPARIITLLPRTSPRTATVAPCPSRRHAGRQCKRLGLELTSTPVGFKWIYAEMEKGDVMPGGEESGIGIPSHVMERDGC